MQGDSDPVRSRRRWAAAAGATQLPQALHRFSLFPEPWFCLWKGQATCLLGDCMCEKELAQWHRHGTHIPVPHCQPEMEGLLFLNQVSPCPGHAAPRLKIKSWKMHVWARYVGPCLYSLAFGRRLRQENGKLEASLCAT